MYISQILLIWGMQGLPGDGEPQPHADLDITQRKENYMDTRYHMIYFHSTWLVMQFN